MAATAAATETERELDRVWKALDDATGRISDLERALERGRGLQLAPAPDYRINDAGTEVGARCGACGQRLDAEADRDAYHAALLDAHTPAPDVPPACRSCDLPMARYAGPRAGEGGWTCLHCESPVTDEEPEPVEVCSCEEAVALRKDVEHYRSLWDESRATVERLVAERDAARTRVDELAEARAEALSQRNAFASEVAALRRLAT